jgi:hypothetical protein
MRKALAVVCALASALCSIPIRAQELQVQVDGGGFASFTNFTLGSRQTTGGERPELTFEISIVNPPPCGNIAIFFDLLTPSGAYIRRGAMAAGTVDELRSIQQGQTYVAHIVDTDLDTAGSINIWPECSAIR